MFIIRFAVRVGSTHSWHEAGAAHVDCGETGIALFCPPSALSLEDYDNLVRQMRCQGSVAKLVRPMRR